MRALELVGAIASTVVLGTVRTAITRAGRMRRTIALLCVMAIVMFLAPAASAAAGDLDTNFGSGGWVATDLGGAGAISMAVGTGIVVLARSPDETLSVLRYQLDGSLDTTFSDDGTVQVPFHGYVADMIVDAHGKPLVMADAGRGPTLERFLPDGTIDRTFGDAESVSVAGHLFLRSVALQPDGKILLVGDTLSERDVVILRLRAGGALDPSFGDGGQASPSRPHS